MLQSSTRVIVGLAGQSSIREFCVLVAMLALVNNAFSQGNDATLRAQFLKEYEPNARDLQEFYSNIRVKFITTHDSPKGDASAIQGSGRFNANNYLLEASPKNGAKDKLDKGALANTSIEGRNVQYNFTLNSKGSNVYVQTQLILHQEKAPTALCFLTAPFADYQFTKQPFIQLVSDKSITFLEFQDAVWQNMPAKKLVLRVPLRHGTNLENESTVIVAFYFSPVERWVCRGATVHKVEDSSRMREEVYVYESQAGAGFPVLKRQETWLRIGKEPGNRTRMASTEITEFVRCTPFDDSEFRLSAFGLPEPTDIVWNKRSYWYLWFMAIAGASIAFGWFLWRNQQQRKLRQASAEAKPKFGTAS